MASSAPTPLIIAVLTGVKGNRNAVLICISPIVKYTDPTPMCLLYFRLSTQVISPTLAGLLVLLLLSLYILNINPLEDEQRTKII